MKHVVLAEVSARYHSSIIDGVWVRVRSPKEVQVHHCTAARPKESVDAKQRIDICPYDCGRVIDTGRLRAEALSGVIGAWRVEAGVRTFVVTQEAMFAVRVTV